MINLFTKYKTIVLIIAIVVVVFALYLYFLDRDDKGPLLGSESVSSGASAIVGKEFLATLLELRSLKLDETIFSKKSFISLVDFSQEVLPQPAGRTNPFLEIGVDPVSFGSNSTKIPLIKNEGVINGDEN